MMHMIIAILLFFGLMLGSFVNALIWRLYKQSKFQNEDGSWKKLLPKEKQQLKKLSITKGRSMCMHCNHELAPKDLIPVFSWLFLRGKCRYCQKPIDDTPIAELLVPLLLVVSYLLWPYAQNSWTVLAVALFVVWSLVLTAFVALTLYDARWYLLPDRIVVPLTLLAFSVTVLRAIDNNEPKIVLMALLGGITISGIFLLLSLLSKGAWIGGGDIKLGVSLGLLAGNPLMAILVIFLASVLATAYMLPGILRGKMKLGSMLPFGPFLITACVIVFLVGNNIFTWYINLLTA